MGFSDDVMLVITTIIIIIIIIPDLGIGPREPNAKSKRTILITKTVRQDSVACGLRGEGCWVNDVRGRRAVHSQPVHMHPAVCRGTRAHTETSEPMPHPQSTTIDGRFAGGGVALRARGASLGPGGVAALRSALRGRVACAASDVRSSSLRSATPVHCAQLTPPASTSRLSGPG